MKDLLNKLSSDLERIGELTKSSHLSALYKFASPDPPHNTTVVRFNLDNDEDLRFDSGKWIIKPAATKAVKAKIVEKISEWLGNKGVSNWQINILIKGNASRVPISMGNVQLANNRAGSLKKIIEGVVVELNLQTDDPNSSKVNEIKTLQGEVTGPKWDAANGKSHSMYREHQFVTVAFVATGEKVPPDEPHGDPEPKAKTGSWCINLGGLQIEVECTVKGNVAKCSLDEKGFRASKDFGWHIPKSSKPCPTDPNIINVSEEWKGYFYVCQDKCSGMLLKADNGAPYVGVQSSDSLKPILHSKGMWFDNFITYEQLASLCKKQSDSKMIKVIDWPEKEECDDGLPNIVSSDYCDLDSRNGMQIKQMLPIRKGAGSNKPGVVDIIYDYLSKGWRKPTYISGRMSSSSGGSSEGTTGVLGTGKKFYYFKSERHSRDLARQAWSSLKLGEDVNFGRESNEKAIKDRIEEWINDGNKLDANVKGIQIQRLFRVSARSLHTECSGWDYIRWGGPCETWAADARYGEDVPIVNKLKGEFSGPNGGTSSTNPNSKPYLPYPDDNAKHQRILNWFIGHGGMSNEIEELEQRQLQFYAKHSKGNDPGTSQVGDTQQTEKDWSHDQRHDSHGATSEVMDHMLDSRGFRRNLLRRIKKESSK